MLTQRRRWLSTIVGSLAAIVVATIWFAVPEAYPFGSGDNVRSGVNRLIEREAGAAMLLVAAVLGLVLAIGALWTGMPRAWARVTGVGAGLEALFFGFVMSDSSVMAALGYAVALGAPVGVVVGLVVACRAWRPVRLVTVLLVAILGVLGFVTGALGNAADAAAAYLSNFTSDPDGYYPRIAWALGMAGVAGCWTLAAVGSLGQGMAPSRVGSESVMRWGRLATIVAALCPVPYGLARLSWLTPWRFGDVDPAEPGRIILWNSNPAELDSAAVIQGGLFALAASVAVLLTLGLVCRWGEVFPRWFPHVGGRPVPVMLAVGPGVIVAAIITLAAPGFMMVNIESLEPYQIALGFFFLPFPLWGPALGVAVCAYWLRRTGGRSQTSTAPSTGGLVREAR